MSETTNLGLPFIAASQAQKHITHNEALLALDAVIQVGIVDRDLTVPPVAPTEGAAYIPATGATTDWAGQDLSIACWQDGAWSFHIPQKGWMVYLVDESVFAFWDGSAWSDLTTTISALQNMIALGINTTADATNKLAVASDAVLFNNNGSGVQIKINKTAIGDTASQLFQTGFSGRAEFGLTGDDDFHVKVSPDGSAWRESLQVDNNTGSVAFPNGALHERHIPASINSAGGTDWWGPADHLTTSYSSASGFVLVADRMYFAAFFVPRPLLLLGGFVSMNVASSVSGAVLRAGIYQLGAPNGDNWDVGNLISDFGTQAADVANNKIFDLATPITVEPGWYLAALGVSGATASVIYARWHQPGLTRYYPYGSGSSCRPRISGPSYYMYESNSNAEIVSGLPATWTKNPISDSTSTNNFSFNLMYPKWREL